MSANNLELDADEYKQLLITHRSEGYAIMTRIINATMNVKMLKMMGPITDSEIIKIRNEVVGMRESKDLVFNFIKEGEGKYEDS